MKNLFIELFTKIFFVFIILNTFIANSESKELTFKNDEARQKFYYKHIKKAKDSQIVVIPANTLSCHSREVFKKAYKYIVNMGGHNINMNYLRTSLGCHINKTKRYGLVSGVDKKSQIVRILYKAYPVGRAVANRYFNSTSVYMKSQERDLIK